MAETRLSHEEVMRVAQAMSKKQMLDDDVRALARGSGIVPTAEDDVLLNFPNDGSESFEEFITRIKPTRPHWFPPPEIGHNIDPALIEAACGEHPTLGARAKLRDACIAADGEDLYVRLLDAWGASQKTLAPGRNPKATDKEVEDVRAARKPQASNPWSRAGWNVSKQGQLVTTLGIEKASAIAVAAGCVVGSTKPNAAYN